MRIKKTLCLILAMAMMLMLVACGDSSANGSDAGNASKIKIGCIMLGDETEGYTAAHINGIKAAAEELGLSDNLVWKYKVGESSACYDAAVDLVGRAAILFSPTATAIRLTWYRQRRSILM